MRHIPEDELHAYLDQALSRSQCVEIESHLADCPSCRALRDGIAALRDRTTALLARLAPPRRVPIAFEVLRRQADERASVRRRRIRIVAWAASVAVAVGAGWAVAALSGPGRNPARATGPSVPGGASVSIAEIARDIRPAEPSAASPKPAPTRGRPVSAPRTLPTDQRSTTDSAGRAPREDSARQAKLALLDAAPALTLEPIQPATDQSSEYGGLWRTMSWDGARSEAGDDLPHIEGLPVIRVQVQASEQGKRPLMVVAQQLASGQVIETIEGPASDVSQFLSRRGEGATALAPGEVGLPSSADQSMAMQVGDRMLAVSAALPPDSLRAMIRRINAEMRGK